MTSENLVEQLLKEAGAPAVISREGISTLTEALAEIDRYASGIQSLTKVEIDRYESVIQSLTKGLAGEYLEGQKLGRDLERAQEAVAELRLVVPRITTALRKFDVIAGDQSKANEIEAWLKATPDFLPPKKKRDPKKKREWEWRQTWAIHAVWLFSRYQRTTGPCGASRDGPAVKFIKLAFDHCGIYKEKTREAIAKVITDARQQPGSERYFPFDR